MHYAMKGDAFDLASHMEMNETLTFDLVSNKRKKKKWGISHS